MSVGIRPTITALLLSSLAVVACANEGGGSTHENNNGSSGKGGNSGGSISGGGNGGIDNTPTIILASCGNGKVESGEECDDGNLEKGDGCNRACQVEADYECPPTGGKCTSTSKCGDGRLSSNEVCDDGNAKDGDGCSADCKTVETGWQCRGGTRCVPICGDGMMKGTETCDDSNTNDGDGCSSTCITEPGWSCDGTHCTQSKCGNGTVEAGESCDKGDENGLFFGDGKGCSKTCTPEPTCRDDKGNTGACHTACGDGNIDPGEACDDGNGVDGDGCTHDCQTEQGFVCGNEEKKDTVPCSQGGGDCLVLPITYRDFDGQNLSGGHPDFFYYGGKTTCVPNASGRTDATWNGTECSSNDSTDLCRDLVKDTLGADGKPVANSGRTNGFKCACRFTDWDNPHVIPQSEGGDVHKCTVTGESSPGYRYRIETTVSVFQSADSFKQWYTDSNLSAKSYGTLELKQQGNSNQYQFSSSNGRTVYDDIHDIFLATVDAAPAGAVTSLSSGFFPLENSNKTKICNLWPYWATELATDCTARAETGKTIQSQWDPRGWDGNTSTAPACGTGAKCPSGTAVKGVKGVARNFYMTTEARYLFRYAGGEKLAFFGDDDVWVFLNGHLVLDLGAPHERLQGTVTLNANGGADWEITALDVVTGAATSIKKGNVPPLGLETGKTYEIAVFHADVHPRESNYQLTVSGFSTTRSVCQPHCGDKVVTATEECDDGDANEDGKYGGCGKDCKFGPFCGDGEVNGPEECDKGRDNGATYGEDGCTSDCKKPHHCGDGIIDSEHEECDDGENNGKGVCQGDCTLRVK